MKEQDGEGKRRKGETSVHRGAAAQRKEGWMNETEAQRRGGIMRIAEEGVDHKIPLDRSEIPENIAWKNVRRREIK